MVRYRRVIALRTAHGVPAHAALLRSGLLNTTRRDAPDAGDIRRGSHTFRMVTR